MYFRRKFALHIRPVGPVLLTPGSKARSNRDFRISEDCKNWFDKKRLCSVLYVPFGSQNTISASQMMQLAMALEGCGKNFIWVVMSPLGFDINSEFKANEWLPEGFEERIEESGRGLSVDLSIPPFRKLHTNSSFFLQQLHIVKQFCQQWPPNYWHPMAQCFNQRVPSAVTQKHG
ncbi:hypothetical protein Patl1_29796 [Pistacia atlantica]|uniref:Uncharacterized protein n=1 Tax=Pistacia atlantica TaxID=434234 RepID=A0ACC1ACN3_9ROSI|nr:hypothetical protein Patl1_29796 [Pistacia atlantica]